ncbi:hypothetical protein IscW_ISCW005960 [Ixodes scapularis]|uniref:Uncharacterized protein n=1 Tax=Ixodes scapularis TaxID=6945 RepID=B7PN75_IXOSC|nr:hypothetical protein IscW_ISCW005960 [Ixodes scapularis]|eukprot:XP_002435223.1 hypothetical protein IscW_ISCW005960 [Ixodes scapularis]
MVPPRHNPPIKPRRRRRLSISATHVWTPRSPEDSVEMVRPVMQLSQNCPRQTFFFIRNVLHASTKKLTFYAIYTSPEVPCAHDMHAHNARVNAAASDQTTKPRSIDSRVGTRTLSCGGYLANAIQRRGSVEESLKQTKRMAH